MLHGMNTGTLSEKNVMRKAKAHMELNLARDVKDKNSFSNT